MIWTEVIQRIEKRKITHRKQQTRSGIIAYANGLRVSILWQGDYRWHGKPLNDGQLVKALAQLPEILGDY